MNSKALTAFDHAIQDSTDLLKHFDSLNAIPEPPDIEVLKRASLVMALAALETYFEDRLTEAIESICGKDNHNQRLTRFFSESLQEDLRYFHTPSTDRVRPIFQKYLNLDVTEAWSWNNCEPAAARKKLNDLAKKRGDIAHRSLRPVPGEAQPKQHAVTRDDLRKYIHFVTQIAQTTDKFLAAKI